jgi:hypothetical protein
MIGLLTELSATAEDSPDTFLEDEDQVYTRGMRLFPLLCSSSEGRQGKFHALDELFL